MTKQHIINHDLDKIDPDVILTKLDKNQVHVIEKKPILKNQLIIFSLNIFIHALIFGIFLFFAIYTKSSLENGTDAEANKSAIPFFVFLLILAIIYLAIVFSLNLLIIKNKFIFAKAMWPIYALTLSIPILISFLFTKNDVKLITRQQKNKWYQIKTKDVAMIGLLLGVYLILDFAMSFAQLPFFISISLKFIPLFLAAYLLNFFKTIFLAIICGIVGFFMPNNLDSVNVWAYLFDYFFPILSVSLACFIKVETKDKLSFLIQCFCFITIPYLVMYFSRVIAGVLFWFAGAWDGYDRWTYSFIFNLPNSISDWILGLLLVPPLLKAFSFIRQSTFYN